MCNETSLARGADLAKLDKYLRENVSVTCFSRMMDTPGSESSFVDFAFLDACEVEALVFDLYTIEKGR